MKNKQDNVEFYPSDESYMRKTTLVEEYIDIDASLIELEKNGELIRMEMNIIEFPIFSRSRKLNRDQIKKYYFSSNKSSYLEITPGNKETIPGELDERVFIALLKIFKEKGYQQNFYCSMSEIINNLNVSKGSRNAMYERVKKSLNRLAVTNLKFKNLFYSSLINKPIDDLVNTNILSYVVLTSKDVSQEEVDNLFFDKRIKEIYRIMLSTHFYENIIRKGYLVFDSDELLSIKDSVTRSIYTMITKWRNSKTYLRRPAFHIARRIPLAWGKSSTRKTVLKIEKSLKELKEFGYITNFNFIKGTKVDNSEFEIFFSEEHNKNKQIIFYDEKADFDKIIHLVEERQNNFELPQLINNEKNLKIIEIFGIKGKNLKTLGSVVEEALKTYDYKYVLYSAEYTMINAKVSLLKYFKDTLANNWADEYIAKKIVLEEKKEPLKKLNIEEATIIEEVPKFTWEEFENASIEEQERITGIAYEYFLKKAEAIDNKSMRGIFEKSKKSLIIDISKSHSLRTIEKNLSSNNSEEIFVDNFKNIKELIEIDKETKTSNSKIDEENSIGDINYENDIKFIEYVSVMDFVMDVVPIIKKNRPEFDMKTFKELIEVFGSYEDKYIKVAYEEKTKLGGYKMKGEK